MFMRLPVRDRAVVLGAETCCTGAPPLEEPEPGGELVRGEAWEWQPLMRTVIVLRPELLDQVLQRLRRTPGPIRQPLLESAHEPLAIPFDSGRWRAMSTWTKSSSCAN